MATVTGHDEAGREPLSSVAAATCAGNQMDVATHLTLVTVTFNASKWIQKTLDSVSSYKRPGVRYIVVDGGSKDGTQDIIRGHVSVDRFVSEPDKGIYDAMNKAVALAPAGSYLLFLGAGDVLLDLPPEEDLIAFRNAGIRLLYGDVMSGAILFRSEYSGKLKYRNTMHHQALFCLKVNKQNEQWFDTAHGVYADWDFNLRCYYRGDQARRIERVIAFAQPDGISAKTHLVEVFNIIWRRAGFLWAALSVAYHFLSQRRALGQLLRRFR